MFEVQRPSQTTAEQGEAKLPKLNFKTTWSELQKPCQTAKPSYIYIILKNIISPESVPSSCMRQHTQDVPGTSQLEIFLLTLKWTLDKNVLHDHLYLNFKYFGYLRIQETEKPIKEIQIWQCMKKKSHCFQRGRIVRCKCLSFIFELFIFTYFLLFFVYIVCYDSCWDFSHDQHC